MIVGFQGEPGAFSEDAALSLLGGGIATRGFPTFDALLEAVALGTIDAAMLPVENSIAGIVHEAVRARSAHPMLRESDAIEHPIAQCLVGLGAATTESVVAACSHPVALAQCAGFFRRHSHIEPVAVYDTAGAVADIVKSADATRAAIASARAAELYGAAVIQASIQDEPSNRTRFLLLTPP